MNRAPPVTERRRRLRAGPRRRSGWPRRWGPSRVSGCSTCAPRPAARRWCSPRTGAARRGRGRPPSRAGLVVAQRAPVAAACPSSSPTGAAAPFAARDRSTASSSTRRARASASSVAGRTPAGGSTRTPSTAWPSLQRALVDAAVAARAPRRRPRLLRLHPHRRRGPAQSTPTSRRAHPELEALAAAGGAVARRRPRRPPPPAGRRHRRHVPPPPPHPRVGAAPRESIGSACGRSSGGRGTIDSGSADCGRWRCWPR